MIPVFLPINSWLRKVINSLVNSLRPAFNQIELSNNPSEKKFEQKKLPESFFLVVVFNFDFVWDSVDFAVSGRQRCPGYIHSICQGWGGVAGNIKFKLKQVKDQNNFDFKILRI